ncbi:MAG: hypothetical protein R3D05_13490 [Dongiaceae bacterium]
MAARRPIYRKQESRSISKTGLLLCVLLAAGVMVVPVGSDFVHGVKAKLRDMALNSGWINFNDCVVTPNNTIACDSHAFGTPLPVAMRRMEDSLTEAATEKKQRLQAEETVHALALEVGRLNAQLKQARLAASANTFFPSLNGEVKPTGLTGAGASPSPEETDGAAPSYTLTPPSE